MQHTSSYARLTATHYSSFSHEILSTHATQPTLAMQSTSAKYLPKLTQNQKRLLRRHDGCLRCRCFYVNHDTDNCKNNYPNPYALSPLTEEAAVAARASRDRDMIRGTLSDGRQVFYMSSCMLKPLNFGHFILWQAFRGHTAYKLVRIQRIRKGSYKCSDKRISGSLFE